MKKLLIFSFLLLCVPLLYAQQVKEYKGNYTIWCGVVVSSMGVTTNGSARIPLSVTPIISSTTYTGKSDWRIEFDPDGYTVWIGSFSNINTTGIGTIDCNKKKAGSTESPNGRLTDSVFGRTLAGSANLSTCYILISGEN